MIIGQFVAEITHKVVSDRFKAGVVTLILATKTARYAQNPVSSDTYFGQRKTGEEGQRKEA